MPIIKPSLIDVKWPENELTIGVVGVAPWATLDFCHALYSLIKAEKDWHYPRLLIDVNTKIPSRGRYFELDETNPSPYIRQTIIELVVQGAGVVVVPCNTAHILYPDWTENISVPVPSIIDAAVERAISRGGKLFSVFESSTLRKNGLYRNVIEISAKDYLPLSEAQSTSVATFISKIKLQGKPSEDDYIEFKKLILELKSEGVDTIILGCTELSIFMPVIEEYGFFAIDSNIELARASVKLAGCSLK